MSRVQGLDGSPLHQTNGWLPPPTFGGNRAARKETRSDWPFLYSYDAQGSVTVNRGAKKTNYESADEVGVALF